MSDPLGTDNFLGSRDQELEADYREAILLEDLNSMYDLPGGSSDDGAPGSYNVEELDQALEARRPPRTLNVSWTKPLSGLVTTSTRTCNPTRLPSWNRDRRLGTQLQVRHVPGRDINPTRVSGQTEGERACCSPLARPYTSGSRRHCARAS